MSQAVSKSKSSAADPFGGPGLLQLCISDIPLFGSSSARDCVEMVGFMDVTL